MPLVACSSSSPSGIRRECAAGETEACACPDGTVGTMSCEDGRLGTCACPKPFETKLVCAPSTLDFGRVAKGKDRTLEVTCRNEAEAEVTLVIGPIVGGDATLFQRTFDDGYRVVLPPGASFTISVTFGGVRFGPADARLELFREATNGALSIAARIQFQAFTIEGGGSCSPVALDFGAVAPDTEKRLAITCKNESSEPIEVVQLELDATSTRRFTWEPSALPIVIPGFADGVPGEIRIEVAFHPSLEDVGTRKYGILRLVTDDIGISSITFQLGGFAGGPVLACSPLDLDFGTVATGVSAKAAFDCTNVGTEEFPGSAPLLVLDVASTDPAEFSAEIRGTLDPAGFAVGESFAIDVTYHPIDETPDVEAIRIRANTPNADSEEGFQVSVEGLGRDVPVYDLELVPEAIDFGIVDKDRAVTLEFRVRNRLVDGDCLIRDVRLADTCDPAFSLRDGAVHAAARGRAALPGPVPSHRLPGGAVLLPCPLRCLESDRAPPGRPDPWSVEGTLCSDRTV